MLQLTFQPSNLVGLIFSDSFIVVICLVFNVWASNLFKLKGVGIFLAYNGFAPYMGKTVTDYIP